MFWGLFHWGLRSVDKVHNTRNPSPKDWPQYWATRYTIPETLPQRTDLSTGRQGTQYPKPFPKGLTSVLGDKVHNTLNPSPPDWPWFWVTRPWRIHDNRKIRSLFNVTTKAKWLTGLWSGKPGLHLENKYRSQRRSHWPMLARGSGRSVMTPWIWPSVFLASSSSSNRRITSSRIPAPGGTPPYVFLRRMMFAWLTDWSLWPDS